MRAVVTVTLVLLVASLTILPAGAAAPLVTSTESQGSFVQSGDFAAGRVLADESHVDRGSDMWTPGNASLFGWLLGECGYNVSNNWDTPLDSGILSNYDVLSLFFPMVALTSGEVDAIHSFVESGGGLLLVGIDYTASGWQYTPANLNPISETYGITFAIDSLLGRSLRSSGEIANHSVTQNVSSLHSSCDQVQGCSLTVASPATTLATIRGSAFLAVSESGAGRVVAVGGPAPFLQYRHDRGWQVNPNDHFQITLNIVDWLAGNAPRLVDPPEKAVIKIGPGPSLNSTQLEEYVIFNGAIHDHTTFSDGVDSPEDMVIASLEAALDFFVISDHTHMNVGTEGIYGALAAKGYTDTYGLDCPIIVGAELSSIPHTVGFPLTQQIYTSDIQYGIDAIHAQGGIASLSHPTMDASYVQVWENFGTYGYDAFEVVNDGFFHGLGESCYFRSFIGASDGHQVASVGLVRNVVFVKNPTGPNGTISGSDLADAVVNRRLVSIDLHNGVILGQGVWVDRYLELWTQAENAIADARAEIEAVEGTGTGVGLSRMYLEKAETALDWWNPSRALDAATDAMSETILDLDLAPTEPNLGAISPKSDATLAIRLTNRHDHGVQMNGTPFLSTSLTFDQASRQISAGPDSMTTTDFTATATNFGYVRVLLNLRSLNITEKPGPLILEMGGIVSNISLKTTYDDEGIDVSIKILMRRADSPRIVSAQIVYDDGTGEHTADLVNYGDGYSITLGPYIGAFNITFQIVVDDVLGNTFLIDGGTHEIGRTTTMTWQVELVIAGGLGVMAVVVVLFALRRRR